MTNQTIDGVSRALLPCPLCGSDKVSLAWDVYDTDRGRRTQSQIQCLGCRILTKTFKSHAEARAYWNNRAAQHQGGSVEIGYIEHSREFESQLAPVINRLIWTMPADQRHKIPQHYKVMLYAEQPAPVAVEGTRTPFEIEHDAEPGDEAAFRQWRQERLNPTRPTHANPPPGTEPSGTHHDNDGLDEWRKPACCGSCPGGCVIQNESK